RQFLHLIAGAAALPAASRFARAQSYPNKLIKLILPFIPGSPNDILARLVVPYLSSRLWQPVIIDNRPGGGTTIDVQAVMTAPPAKYGTTSRAKKRSEEHTTELQTHLKLC